MAGRRDAPSVRDLAYGRVTQDAPEIGSSAIRTKAVRMSFDVDPIVHANFTRWLGGAALHVHRPVNNVQVFRTILDLLLDPEHPEFAALVLQRLQQR